MRRVAAFILLAAGVGIFAQTVPSETKPQEQPKVEKSSAAESTSTKAESAPKADAAKTAEQPAQSAEKPSPGSAQVNPAEEQPAAPAPPPEVKGPEKKGLAFMKEIAKGKYIATVSYISNTSHQYLSPGKLQYAWDRVGKQVGKITDMTVTHTDLEGDNLVMHVLLTCEKGTAEARLTYSAKAKDDLLTGVNFRILEIAPAS